MLDGPGFVRAMVECGVSHVVWIPDNTTGHWNEALAGSRDLALVRVCREGEAFGVAAGLLIGGRRPVIVIQCTGLFEAGDSLRNFVHDLGLPLFLVVGLRNYYATQAGRSKDTATVYARRIMDAWNIPNVLLERDQGAEELKAAYNDAREKADAAAVFLAE
jgi:sulfopyruvate decarboxylase TPP-binding subunit